MDFDEPEDLSEKLALLGEPKAEFAVRGRAFARNLVVGPLLTLGGLALDITLLFFRHVSFELIMVGVGMILTGIMLVVRAYRNRGLRVLVFREGIVRVRGNDGQALFWDEIDSVWRKKIDGHWEKIWKGALNYSVERPDGKAIDFDDSIPELEELGRILNKETFVYLWPRYLAAYDNGATLDFGQVRLSKRGLSTASGNLPWLEVQEVKFEDNQFTISKKGKWTSWFQGKVAQTRNYHICKALVERAMATRSIRQPAPSPEDESETIA
jgi:hypothetical protein